MRITTMAAVLLACGLAAQAPSPLAPIEFMLGEWHGASAGPIRLR